MGEGAEEGQVNTVVYSVFVEDRPLSAGYVVTIYNVGRFRAADFVRVDSSFDDSQFSISSRRQATFQEELRVTGRASDIVEGDDATYLKSKMRVVYGHRVTVTVEPIKPAQPSG